MAKSPTTRKVKAPSRTKKATTKKVATRKPAKAAAKRTTTSARKPTKSAAKPAKTARTVKPSSRAAAPKPSRSRTAQKPAKAAARAAAKPKKPSKSTKTVQKKTVKTAAKTATKTTAKRDKSATKAVKAPPATAKAAPKAEKTSKPAAAPKAAQAPAEPSDAIAKAVQRPKASEKPAAEQFLVDDFVVYPTHGVGRIVGIERQNIAGLNLQLFVIDFEKEKMTLRVPVTKAGTTGMRRLSSPEKMHSALATLKGRARVKRTMWSRRAQEYEAKINSGDPVSIAEVVRDLYRAAGQPEQSYSERQIYEAALDRLVREFAAVEGLNEEQATERLEKLLRAA